jgi:N-acetyl-gamma-glutamylphosphate reductase
VQDEEFVVVLEKGIAPQTRHVRGSNYCLLNVFEDRISGRAIIISVVSSCHANLKQVISLLYSSVYDCSVLFLVL